MSYSKNPSCVGMKLLACGNAAIDTAGVNDLPTYVDCTPFEEILFVLVSAKLGAETGTDVAMACRESASSDGTGSVAVNDRDGAALLVALGGSAAAGRGTSMQVRCTGRKKFLSPALIATGAAVTCSYAVYGIGTREASENASHWTDEAGASIDGQVIA